MAAAPPRRKRPVPAAAAMHARRFRGVLCLTAGTLAASAVLVSNPFAESRLFPPAWVVPATPIAPPPRLPIHAIVAALPLPKPVPVHAAASVQTPTPTAAATGSIAIKLQPAPAVLPRKSTAGKRGPIIVEVLPPQPIIPPFVPKQAVGAPPTLRPALPLDTELTEPWAPAPSPHVAAEPNTGVIRTSAERNG